MKLTYKAARWEGKIVTGTIEAKNASEAAVYLRNKKLIPIRITKQTRAEELLKSAFLLGRSHTNEVILFTRQLSSTLTAGLTLIQALLILREQMQNDFMKEVTNQVITDVEQGLTFSIALSKHPNVFSPIYVSLVAAGESSGFLDKILSRLADNLEKAQKLRATVKSALMYPMIVVILMIVVMFIMMIFVIPQLTTLYKNLNVDLPFITQVVVNTSNFSLSAWPVIVASMVLLGIAYQRWQRTNTGQLTRDKLLLRLPVFGKIIKESILAEFARTLGLLVSAGTLVVQSLIETADTAGNRVFKDAIKDIAVSVEKGVTMGDAMNFYPVFPPILVQMVKIGEQTGKLDESLLKASEYFEREVDGLVKTLTTALEPFIMIVLGIGVAFLIISIITPIYNLTSSIH